MAAMSKYPIEMKSNLDETITNLQSAKDALAADQFRAAVSHAAEAAFHTGSMLLLDEEIEPGQHADVVTLIQERFVNERRLTKEQGGNLSWLFALRHAEARETTAQINSEEARKAVEIADTFFAAAKVILEA
jgi:uncharacterized protein (UPF0332 family)